MPQAPMCRAWAVTVFVSCRVPCVCSEFWCASFVRERVSVEVVRVCPWRCGSVTAGAAPEPQACGEPTQ